MTLFPLRPLVALLFAGAPLACARPGAAIPPPTALPAFSTAQSAPPLWHEVPVAQARRAGKPRLGPSRYRTVAFDLAALKATLAQAPTDAATGPLVLLPLPDGTQQRFRLRASRVMAPELAAKYPELRAYAGQSPDNPASTVRLELTPQGLRAMLMVGGHTVFIEPYSPAQTRFSICFDQAALPAGSKHAFEISGTPVR